MKIDSFDIGMSSQHSSSKQLGVTETLRAWVGSQRPNFEGGFEGSRSENRAPPIQPIVIQPTVVNISAAGQQAATHAAEITDAAQQASNDPGLQLLISLVEAMTGQKVRLFNPNDLQLSDAAPAQPVPQAATAQPSANQRQGWGVEYDSHETLHETEQTSFSAQGVIKTSDGKQIQFNLSLVMQREFVQHSDVSIRQGDGVKKDPLVINFDGNAAQLTDTKFSFDLNNDGQTQQVSFVTAGSGFLALDKNGNGKIDNGSELFGPQSGNGFADLAAYDSDGNHWIDQNDAIYSKLKVWSKDASGKDMLSTLTQRNVGALYLGNAATPFELKNAAHDSQGQVRSTGVYLLEDGSAGTLQQVDLVV